MKLKLSRDKLLSKAGILIKIPALFFILMLFSKVAAGTELYWVGGSGNWSDINHWSLSSGNSGGYLSPSIPQAGDHVIFNGQSGFGSGNNQISIDQKSSCYSITVSGILTNLRFTGTVLHIYGSAEFQTGTMINNSSVYFQGSNSNTINFNEGVNGNSTIYFKGSGSWLLKGNLNNTGKIYFLQGSLDFGSSVITTGFFDENGCCGTVPSGPLEPRSLNLGSSLITLTDRNSQSNRQSPTWVYTGAALMAGTSQINISRGANDGYGVSFIGRNGHSYNKVSFTNTAEPSNTSPQSGYLIAEGNCSFATLSFASSGFIASDCKIDTLKLARSKSYFISGSQKIGSIQNPTPACQPLWSLSGYGGTATINSSSSINLHYVKLQGIRSLGAGSFTVTSGVDAGNNLGWVFTSTERNLYWIGGGGNWNDPSHWTTNFDGTSSGDCMPSRNDNVYFNEYSGHISEGSPVYIATSDAECNSIIWKGNGGTPVFKTAKETAALSIYGSSEWQKGMVYQVASTYYVGTKRGNTLKSNGVIIEGNTHFTSNGGWSFNDQFSSPLHSIIFLNGHLNTNDQTIVIKNFGSVSRGTGTRTLTLGNSILNIGGDWAYVGYGGPEINLNSGNSQINLTAASSHFYYHSGLDYNHISFNNANGNARLYAPLYSTTLPATFAGLTFKGHADINSGGNPTPIVIADLNFSASKKYVLGGHIEIKAGNLHTDGQTCSGLLELSSDLPNVPARLNLANPAQINNAKVSSIHAIGEQLTVIGGIDGANNQNIIIIPATPRNLYWIGGNGNWSDSIHWTLSPTGAIDQSGVCPPTLGDNVFFNQFSGVDYTVKLDIKAQCHDMVWSEVPNSKPTLKGLLVNPLTIYGSMVLQTGMNYDVERTNFEGSGTENIITTNQVKMGYAALNVAHKGVFFNAVDGRWLLADTLNVRNFGVINGTLNTNGQTINAENYCSENISVGSFPKLILGSSVINIAGYWDAGTIASIEAGSSTINLQGTMPQNNATGGGVNNNEFNSKPALVYHDLNFINPALIGLIKGSSSNAGNIFNNVSFSGESSINGSNQFNMLTLGAGKNIHLMAGAVQTIHKLISYSSCGAWNFDNNCMSSDSGCLTTQKAIIKSTSNISLENVNVSGISAIGNATYSVKGADMGNNLGWAFSSPISKNLYWIGGSGSWHDPKHWTSRSDGTSSGGCLPTRFDNVFFNAYSGETPIINITGIAEFQDMVWQDVIGSPIISGTLACYGSMTLQHSLKHFGGINFLSEKTGNSIATNGAIIGTQFDINFSGTGSYVLLDDLTTHTRINMTGGILNTNGKTVRALSFTGIEKAGKPLSLILGSSEIYLNNSGEGWTYLGNKLDAGTSHIYLREAATLFRGKDGALYHAITFDAIDNRTNYLYGGIVVDELNFSAKNSTYQIEAGKRLSVKKSMQMSGTNCSIVQVQSTETGKQAEISLPEGSQNFNFISVKDINSLTKITFLAQSTDAGNNTNLIFKQSTGSGIDLLGKDTVACSSDLPVVLEGYSFMPNDHTKILWFNLTTGDTLGTNIKQLVNSSGTYGIKVMYDNNCSVTDEIKVTIIPDIDLLNQVIVTQPTCSSPVGSIKITPTNETTYSLDGKNYSSDTFYELTTGNYTLLAKNSSGCAADTMKIVINSQPLPPTASITYGAIELHALGKVDVIQNGQNGGTYSAFPDGLVIDPSTGSIDLENSIPLRSYTVTYTFTNGLCTASTSVQLQITLPSATISYGTQDYCPIGTVNIKQTGPPNGNYTASPEGLQINKLTGTIELSASKPGFYTVTYWYSNGSASTVIKINEMPNITVSSDRKNTISKGEPVFLTASGGVSYSWVGAGISGVQNTETIKVFPEQTTTYTVVALNNNGCSNVAEITIYVKEDLLLVPNNVITPNGDGKNDTWVIKNIEYYPNNNVKIFDRAGRLVYLKNSYNNSWNGTLNGKPLNEDAYIYIIDFGNGTGLVRGTLSIVRDLY